MRWFVQQHEHQALGLNFVFLTRTLLTVHTGNARFSQKQDALKSNIWENGDRSIGESWAATHQALEQTIKFVREEMGWTNRRWLPSANALIPVVYLLQSKGGKITQSDRRDLREYLCLTGLRGLFRGSVETTINGYIRPVRKAESRAQRRASLLLKRIPAIYRKRPIHPNEIRSETGMHSPLMQVYLAYLVDKGARSWVNMESLLNVALGKTGDVLAVHHIFPKHALESDEVPRKETNCMANFALLSQSDNAELGHQPPAIAYRQLSPQQRRAAEAQLFFVADDRWLEPDAFSEFLDWRSRKLADRLNKFLGFS
jgi:hypothetical protein